MTALHLLQMIVQKILHSTLVPAATLTTTDCTSFAATINNQEGMLSGKDTVLHYVHNQKCITTKPIGICLVRNLESLEPSLNVPTQVIQDI